MPRIQVEKIDSRFMGGPMLWKVSLPWEVDRVLSAYGETLSRALGRLQKQVADQERAELQADALKRGV